jgi:hypothetical protein
MVDRVDTVQGTRYGIAIAHVADLQLNVVRQVVWPGRALAMDLRREIIERSDAVAVLQQLVGQVRPDKAGAACD